MKSPLQRLALLALSGASVVCAQTLTLEAADRKPTPVVDPASDDAKLALKRFSLPKGLQASLWAAEPMLANPVAFDFDEKGRLFVSETYRYRSSVLDIRDYMGMLERDLALRTIEDRAKMQHELFGAQAKDFAIESEIVRLVEDTDHDGVADKSSIFADGFNSELDGIASGVLARHGQVWFTNIPSLWRLDEKPGGKVEKHELLRGWGVRFNFTGHDFHGLVMGNDGKIYYSIGDRGAHVTGPDGRSVDYPDEGAVYRSNPDGTELEIVHRGLRNPQELVFDEHGNLFTGDNDSDQGDQERLVYVAEGGDSGWRVGYQHSPRGKGGPWMREGLWKPRFPARPAYLLPPICNIEDGPSGLTYYPGTGLTPEYAGHFFLTHFKGSIARSGVWTYTIKENGATFLPTSAQPFMGGILPTDVTFGPDGKFYVLDWTDGWPKSNKGRVYDITPVNADPAQTKISADLKKLLADGFTQRKDAELIALLSHPDRRARLEAQLELASRGAKSAGAFTKVAADKKANQLARLHAIWGLTQLGRAKVDVGVTFTKLLADSDSEVRAQAAKGLGDVGYAKAEPTLVASLDDTASRVAFFAAQSLGKFAKQTSTAPLLALLERNDDKDAYLRFAATHALAKIGRSPALDAAAKSPKKALRLGALLVYRELQDAAIAQFLGDPDAYLAREAVEAINDAPVKGALGALADKLASAPANDEAFVSRAINANYRVGGKARAQAIADYSTNDKATPDMRAEALMQLGLWAETPARDRIVGIFRPMETRGADDAMTALSNALPKLLGEAPEPVQFAAIDAVRSLKLKSAAPALAAIVANAKAPEAVRTHALDTLDALDAAEVLPAVAVADASGISALRLTALQIVARRAPDKALPIIRKLSTGGSEAEQRAAFESLQKLDRPETPKLLVGALDSLAAGNVKPGAQAELLEAVEKSNAPEVKARPDLSKVAASHPVEYLLESVVKPSAHIAPGFDIVTLALNDGNTESGSVSKETASQIELKHADGTTVTVDTKNVKTRTIAPSSMPEIYAQVLTKQQLRDVVAFLSMLDGKRPPGYEEAPESPLPRAMQAVAVETKGGGHP
jgi:quinoprotein glucose dehydrogenase